MEAVPLRELANKETAIEMLFGKSISKKLEQDIVQATDVQQRIEIIELFLLNKLSEQVTVDNIVKTTIDTLLSTKGKTSISGILKEDLSKRRQLERMFVRQIGVSPKQLAKVIRFQSAIKMLLNEEGENLTNIAYESDYYDQAHFIKDFKEYTGLSPKEFLGNQNMTLSTIFYK